MLKIFSTIVMRGAGRQQNRDSEAQCWHCDPLSHPALSAMSQTELADLPWRGAAARVSDTCLQ